MTKKSVGAAAVADANSSVQKSDNINVVDNNSNHNNSKKRSKSNSTNNEKPLTKRQKYKQQQTSDKHAWPQQPKIQSSEARAKAYLRVAGLGSGSDNTTNAKQQRQQVLLDINSPEMKFGRLLASTNQRVRHSAILQMSQYLKARTDITIASSTTNDSSEDPTSSSACNSNSSIGAGLSELDLLKLWKGIWYCVFLADKVPVQEELTKQIANLLFSVAGTEEEDEYAGHAYLQICGDDDDDMYDDDGNDNENHDDDDDDDDDSVDMEEIENTLEGTDEDDDGDDDDDFDHKHNRKHKNQRKDANKGIVTANEDDEDEMENGKELETDDDDDEMIEEGEENRMEIRHCRGAHLASLFVRTFFHTIRREWGKMDKYRVDKFYTLMREMMHVIYKYMAIRHWNRGIVRLFNDALYDEVLNQVPNGLRYHIIDIALDEIVKVNASYAALPLTEATYLDCLEPFFAMAQTGAGGNDTVQTRVMEQILEKFLLRYSVVSDNAILLETEKTKQEGKDKSNNVKKDSTNDEDMKEIYILDDVHVGTIADFIFDIAADTETLERYRKSLYDMYKHYVRRLKEVGRDVDVDGKQNDDDGDLEEVEGGELDDDEEEGEGCDHLTGCNHLTKKDINTNNEVKSDGEHISKKKKTKHGEKGEPAETSKRDRELLSKETKNKDRNKQIFNSMKSEDIQFKDSISSLEGKEKKKKSKKKKRKSSDASDSSNGKPELTEKHCSKERNEKSKKTGAELSSYANGSNTGNAVEEKPQSKTEIKKTKAAVAEVELKSQVLIDKVNSDKQNGEDVSSEKKKRKRKKKRKNSDASDGSSNSNQEVKQQAKEEETITISVKEQNNAKKAIDEIFSSSSNDDSKNANKISKKKRKDDSPHDEDTNNNNKKRLSYDSDGNKRVKFGDLNRARSFKASMKNLRTMETPISKTTPERGILLNKHKHQHQGKKGKTNNNSKQQRKKATDYF